MLSGSLRICFSSFSETCSPESVFKQAYSNSAAAAGWLSKKVLVFAESSSCSKSKVLNAPWQNNFARGAQPQAIFRYR